MLVPGSLMPNDLGLFDMLGNALEWCHDLALLYKGNEDKENTNDEKFVGNDDNNRRVWRGGSFAARARYVRCAYRVFNAPASRLNAVGFRVARTFPLDSFTALPPTPTSTSTRWTIWSRTSWR